MLRSLRGCLRTRWESAYMQGFIRAIVRLVVMALVMGAVLAASVFMGLGATTAIALGIVGAGVVGLLGVARRPHGVNQSAADEIAAMMAPPPKPEPTVTRPSELTSVEAMAPQA